jgi:hypothetical protein
MVDGDPTIDQGSATRFLIESLRKDGSGCAWLGRGMTCALIREISDKFSQGSIRVFYPARAIPLEFINYFGRRLRSHSPRDGRVRRLRVEALEARTVLSITVNSLLDEADGSLLDGDVSLRDAISLATPGETIEFDAALTSGGPATITLVLGEIPIAKDLHLLGPGAHLLAVDASGNDTTPETNDGQGSRVLHVNDGTAGLRSVSIRGLTLTGGDVSGDGGAILNSENLSVVSSTISGNSAGDYGGGISSDSVLSLDAVNIAGNSAYVASGIFTSTLSGNTTTIQNTTLSSNGFSYGGTIVSYTEQGGVTTIRNSTLSGNISGIGGISAYTASGGITAIQDNTLLNAGISSRNYGTTTIDNSTVVAGFLSSTTFPGGSTTIHNSRLAKFAHLYALTYNGGTTAIRNSTVSGSSSNFGGGIYARNYGSTMIQNCTLMGNSAIHGGGIFVDAQAGSTTTIQNSTIVGNSVTGAHDGPSQGGGILVHANGINATVTIENSTIWGNSAEVGGGIAFNAVNIATIKNTIVAGNNASLSAPDFRRYSNVAGQVAFSLIGDNSGSQLAEAQTPDVQGNLVGNPAGAGIIDPMLGPLSDNGGPTQTMALRAGSPAIDAGDPSAVAGTGGIPVYDQRGMPFGRVQDGNGDKSLRVDMGALEIQAIETSACDFDEDGDCDLDDMDALVMQIAAGTHTPSFDLSGDGLVNVADLDQWLTEAGALNQASGNPYLLGDANLDGVVDGSDFGIWNSHKFTSVAAWSAGDFNADGVVDGSDFGIWNLNKFASSDTLSKEHLASAHQSLSTPPNERAHENNEATVDRPIDSRWFIGVEHNCEPRNSQGARIRVSVWRAEVVRNLFSGSETTLRRRSKTVADRTMLPDPLDLRYASEGPRRER